MSALRRLGLDSSFEVGGHVSIRLREPTAAVACGDPHLVGGCPVGRGVAGALGSSSKADRGTEFGVSPRRGVTNPDVGAVTGDNYITGAG
jgi:hypothetical protein